MTISIARLTAKSGVKYLLKTTMHDDGPAIAPHLADAFLTTSDHAAGHLGQAPDQRAAAHEVLSSGRFLDAVVGPAGSGKTTTMAVIRDGWKQAYGASSVVGLAPAADLRTASTPEPTRWAAARRLDLHEDCIGTPITDVHGWRT